MAYLRCDFSSETLQMVTSFIALLPEQLELNRAPVIYLFHGLTDNCTGWTRYTSVERYARDHGAAVIMPEVQRSYYTDMAYGMKYFTYVHDELPRLCRHMFGLSDKRELNYVMGLSMGGYGALKCALTTPERYAGCAAFSAVADFRARASQLEPWEREEFKAVLGPNLEVADSGDLAALLKNAKAEDLPRFFLTCGDQDGFLEANQRLYRLMAEKGCDAAFQHWNDGHTWTFWDPSIKRAMDALLPPAPAQS